MTRHNVKARNPIDRGRRRFLGDSLRVACGVGLVAFGLGTYQRQARALPAMAIRPPGVAGSEQQFQSACVRCGLCVRDCPFDTLKLAELRKVVQEGDNPSWREYVHGEHTVFGQSMQWVTDGHEKYVWLSGSGHEQLFDLDADPQELHDLARDPAEAARVARWRQVLIAELTGREEGFTDGRRLIAGRPVSPVLSHVLG